MSVIINDAENEYTRELPIYLRGYDKFFKFIKLVTNYINQAKVTLENIDRMILSFGILNEDYVTSVMNIYCNNYGIPLSFAGVQTSERAVAAAIKCIGFNRQSLSTMHDMNDGFLANASGVVDDYTFTDKSIVSPPTYMACELKVDSSEDLNPKYIKSLITPNVTGVLFNTVVTVITKKTFAYDHTILDNKDKYGGWDEGSWATQVIRQ